jgi:hypothetical protein
MAYDMENYGRKFVGGTPQPVLNAMNIQLNRPYKIIPDKLKVYEHHYNIPAERSVVVPTRILGEEAVCDIRWESNDEAQVIHHAVFIIENLMKIQPLADEELYVLWKTHSDDVIKN